MDNSLAISAIVGNETHNQLSIADAILSAVISIPTIKFTLKEFQIKTIVSMVKYNYTVNAAQTGSGKSICFWLIKNVLDILEPTKEKHNKCVMW